VPVSELLQQSGPYGAVIALISLIAYWLRLRDVRLMAKKHGVDHALRYAEILFRPKWLPRRPTWGTVESRDETSPPQLGSRPGGGRDDLRDRRSSGGVERADPDESGDDQPGAA
jgi:hypothetical protein